MKLIAKLGAVILAVGAFACSSGYRDSSTTSYDQSDIHPVAGEDGADESLLLSDDKDGVTGTGTPGKGTGPSAGGVNTSQGVDPINGPSGDWTSPDGSGGKNGPLNNSMNGSSF
jgi:hypothetical protein